MIARPFERGSHWWQTLILSLLAHGAVAAVMFDAWPALSSVEPPAIPQIEVTSLALETGRATAVGLDPAGGEPAGPEPAGLAAPAPVAPVLAAPVAPIPGPADGEAVPVAPDRTVAAQDPRRAVPEKGERLLPADDQAAVTVAVAPDHTMAPGAPKASGPAFAAATAAPDAVEKPQTRAVADLVGMIRARLGDACLIALPEAAGTEVSLNVLAERDDSIDAFLAALDRDGLPVPLAERATLLDARQCPALAFARTAASYPVYPLTLALEQAEIASGGHLRGQIGGIPTGTTPVLLLVDDNGVVQDLTRFTRPAGDAIEFDIPVRLAAAPRDTSQLLVALAAPERPAAVTDQAGRLAEPFFAALAAETGRGIAMGVTPFHLR